MHIRTIRRNGNILISEQETLQFMFPTVSDSVAETTESFAVYVRIPGLETELLVEADVLDDDGNPPSVTFDATATPATEGSDVALSVSSSFPVPFEYRVENVAAALNADYTGPTEWTPIDSSGRAPIPTLPDSDNEGTESLKVLSACKTSRDGDATGSRHLR
jgi:hypothetical protein